MRRYALIGGAAAWRLPLVAAVVAAGAMAMDAQGLAGAVAVLAWMAWRLCRAVVIEVSPDGLARGLDLGDGLVGRAATLPWSAVVDVHTDWSRPGSDLALQTTIQGLDGTTVRLSTAMGLRAYWACLADVARRAPPTAASGLTRATLASGPPGGRDLLAAFRTAGALALVLAVMAAVFYISAGG